MFFGYVIPLLLLLLFFLSAYFLLSGLSKIILIGYVIYLIILPFVLLYRQEVKEYRKDKNKVLNDEESGA
ncbi:hypothetical protein ACTWQL_09485 [Pseudalkalibacillus sp. R45]|uniref:hypothetical protein n=1 Tax=Pseudalkalibacillus sp. R45 TaxID=3457433 RepID=UPI003FCD588F